jgi:hypothetical protein
LETKNKNTYLDLPKQIFLERILDIKNKSKSFRMVGTTSMYMNLINLERLSTLLNGG